MWHSGTESKVEWAAAFWFEHYIQFCHLDLKCRGSRKKKQKNEGEREGHITMLEYGM
jgi:hypothetical protein